MSTSPADLVREFHRAFGLDARSKPTEVPAELVAHELADVVYVAYGTALVHGIDLDEVIAEIHRSNMTKLGPDGQVARRADGKVLKGDHYRAPDVSAVLRRQGWAPMDA
jgi:predicted HAD superfamily Cof-like phosphohydrolase